LIKAKQLVQFDFGKKYTSLIIYRPTSFCEDLFGNNRNSSKQTDKLFIHKLPTSL